jgi:hypothetical protein
MSQDDGTSLLARCGNRAIDKLERCFDSAQESAGARAALLHGASDIDRQVLRTVYTDALLNGFIVSGFASFPFYLLSGRRRPVLSVLAGSVAGAIAGSISGAARVPGAAWEIAAQPGPSAIADSIICPVVNEFSPCEQDARCRAMVSAGSNGRGETLLECVRRCRERERALSPLGGPLASAQSSVRGSEAELEPPLTEEVDPFFAGGFDQNPR